MGHFANKCPGLDGDGAGLVNKNGGEKRNYSKFQNNNDSNDAPGNNRVTSKACSECGHIGRHPKGSTCSSVKRKKTKNQEDGAD